MLTTTRLSLKKPENADAVLIGDINDNSDILDDATRYNANEGITGTWSFPNAGLTLKDTDASHVLTLKPGSNLSNDRILTITTGDVDRTISIYGNPTLYDWFNEGIKTTDWVHHNYLTIQNNIVASGTIASSGVITGTRYISNIAAGTSPLTVTSTTLNANLNADLLDGYHSSSFQGVVPSGDLTAGSNKVSIGGDYTGAVLGTGATVDITEANITHNNIGGLTVGNPHTQYVNAVGDTPTLDLTLAGQSISGGIVHSAVNHDLLMSYSANRHIDHTSVSISTSTGLSGGGDISSTRTLSLSHLGIQNLVDPNADKIIFWDDSAGKTDWLIPGDGLSITGTTINNTGIISMPPVIAMASGGTSKALSPTGGGVVYTDADSMEIAPGLLYNDTTDVTTLGTPTRGYAVTSKIQASGINGLALYDKDGLGMFIADGGSVSMRGGTVSDIVEGGFPGFYSLSYSSLQTYHAPYNMCMRAGGTESSPTKALADYAIGIFGFRGYLDTDWSVDVARISAYADSDFSNTNAETHLSFCTTPSGSVNLVERMRLKSDGGIRIIGMTTAGFVKNEVTTGLLSGGNSLVVSDIPAMTSAEFATKISDETGTDKVVLNTSPILITPTLGVAKANSINAPDAGGLGLYEDGGAGVFVKDGGNVGIGTATPGSKLQVVGGPITVGGNHIALITGESIEVSPASGNASYLMNRPTVGDYVSTDWVTGGDIFTGWSMQMPPNQTYLQFIDRVNSLARMVLTNTGRVGINTVLPNLSLETRGIGGAPATSGADQTGVARFGGQYATWDHVLDVGIYTSSPYGLWLQGTHKGNLSLTYPIVLNPNGGNVGIGTSTPSAKLAINGGLAVGEDADPGDNNLKVVGNVSIGSMTTAGFVKNAVTTGLLSGGNALAVADIPTMTSAEFATKVSDETGTDKVVLNTSPVLVTPTLGVAKANSINAPDANGLGLYEDGGAGIFVKDGGNVGIGTLVPASKLQIDVADTDNIRGLVIDFNETGSYSALVVDSESNAYAAIDTRGRFPLYIINDLGGGYAISASRNIAEAGTYPLINFIDDNAANTQTTLRLQQDGTGDIVNFFDGVTEIFTILDGGNVGIGTTTPSAKLAINGGLAVGGDSDPGDNNVLVDGYQQVLGSVIPFGLAMSPIYATDGTYTWGRTNSPTWTKFNGTFTNNNVTAPDGTTTAGTYNLTATSYDMYHLIDPVTEGTVYIFSVWVKLGTATNFCVVVNNTLAWNTVTHKEFTSADGLNATTWTKISLPFIGPASNKVNIHIGAHSETLTQQTIGTVFCWNWEVTTDAGVQINSKVGFYGTTPVARPAHIADATDAATVITRANAIIAALETLGLIASA